MRLLCEPSTWHSTAGPASMARRSRSMSPRPDLGPKPRLGYAASSIERAAERRADAAALAALENDPRARAYVVAGELVVLNKSTAVAYPLFTLEGARARPHGGGRFSRPLRERAAIRGRARLGGRRDAQDTGRVRRHRSALDRG